MRISELMTDYWSTSNALITSDMRGLSQYYRTTVREVRMSKVTHGVMQ